MHQVLHYAFSNVGEDQNAGAYSVKLLRPNKQENTKMDSKPFWGIH